MARMIQAIFVEDEPTVRDLLSRVLERAEIEVRAVYHSAEEFLNQRESPACVESDIFIFDVRLWGMSGLELAEMLRQEGEERPIVLVSAWPAPKGSILTDLDVAFLQKPFDFAELESTIKTLVKR